MRKFDLFALPLLLLAVACKNKDNDTATGSDPYTPKPYVELKHPEWSKNATIYEVNVRQFTPEGTFKAFEPHLQRLKDMGIDIIWLMPIHPIGVKEQERNTWAANIR